MGSLQADFDELLGRLANPGTALADGRDPFYYFAYEPAQMLEVRRSLPAWQGQLRNAGWIVDCISFIDILWETIDASGRWDAWLEYEPYADPGEVMHAVHDAMGQGGAMVERIRRAVSQTAERKVVFLADAGILSPFFRVRGLESALHDQIKVPTVVFYPGQRVGQYGLKFLGLYPEDSNYRATIIGGLP